MTSKIQIWILNLPVVCGLGARGLLWTRDLGSWSWDTLSCMPVAVRIWTFGLNPTMQPYRKRALEPKPGTKDL